jgi:hypothetical protein
MRIRRICGVLLAALLACTVTMAAADAAHGHDGLASKVCQVCYAGHVPALEASLGAHVPPPVFLAFHTPDAPVFHHMAPDCSGGVTRGPPFAL